MSTIPKPGDLVLVKTTEEPVIVLAIINIVCPDLPSGVVLRVRRPVAGQDGISHSVNEFYLEEVEFPNDRNRRLKEEYAAMMAEQAASKPQAASSDSTSSIN